jgi:hypothetical protein
LIHHDTVLVRTALSAQLFLVIKNMAVGPHPCYSPDLVPCDFFLHPRTKLQLRGRRFQVVPEIQEQSLTIHMQFQYYILAEVLPGMAETLDPLHKLR